jgi:hypothetical protein
VGLRWLGGIALGVNVGNVSGGLRIRVPVPVPEKLRGVVSCVPSSRAWAGEGLTTAAARRGATAREAVVRLIHRMFLDFIEIKKITVDVKH